MKYIWGSVITSKDLREDFNHIIALFDNAINEFTEGEVKPRFFSAILDKGSQRLYKYSKKNYDKLLQQLKEGKLTALILNFSQTEYIGGNGTLESNSIQVSVILNRECVSKEQVVTRRNVSEISFSVSEKLLAHKHDFLEWWIKDIFMNIDGISGFIELLPKVFLCGIIKSSPYDGTRKYIPGYYGDFKKKVRGYFWLNILSESHIKILGSIEKIKSDLKFCDFKRITLSGERTAYLFRLDNDIKEFDAKKYLVLKNTFKELLEEEDIKKISTISRSSHYLSNRRLVFNEFQKKQLDKLSERPLTDVMKEVVEENNRAKMLADNKSDVHKIKPKKWKTTDVYDYSTVNLLIEFKSIDKEREKMLNRIFAAWYDVGIFGGFDGLLHDASGMTRIKNEFHMTVDFGSTQPEKVLKILENMINQFAKDEHLEIVRMVVGDI